MTGSTTATGPTRRWIEYWEPEDPAFWARTGAAVARRNLVASIVAEHIGFSVWSLWSVLTLFMVPAAGFHVSPSQKFLLASVATLVGAVLRIPYAFAVGRFGGRRWTVVSTLLLLVPTVFAVLVVRTPAAPFWALLVAAALSGLGGGTFASSTTNINAFYRERDKGRALGLNAGGGNLGVAAVQLVGLLVLAVATERHPADVPLVYVPLILAAALVALRRMDNLAGMRLDGRAQARALADRHGVAMSVLYVGTFGSFIGYGFAFGLVLQNDFGRTPAQAAALTFVGPLLGSLARPVGGALADRRGGARVTLWSFTGMASATGIILVASSGHSLPLFIVAFVAVFVLSGIGNGSTYKMIPAAFERQARARVSAGEARSTAFAEARRRSGALLGVVGAVGAFGGVLINLAFRESYTLDASAVPAFACFLAFYAGCAATTYLGYVRGPARVPAAGTPLGEGNA